MEHIINKALEKDREARYQTASDLRADLKRLKRETESARAVAPVSPPAVSAARTPPLQRRRIALTVGGVIAVAAILLGSNVAGLRDWLVSLVSVPPPRIESVAVLPLENISRDPEQEYFADGMTEELIAELSLPAVAPTFRWAPTMPA